jgi:hypothetical protein
VRGAENRLTAARLRDGDRTAKPKHGGAVASEEGRKTNPSAASPNGKMGRASTLRVETKDQMDSQQEFEMRPQDPDKKNNPENEILRSKTKRLREEQLRFFNRKSNKILTPRRSPPSLPL